MLDSFFEKFLDSLTDPVEGFQEWVEQVAEKITEVAVTLDDDELIDMILKDRSFNTDLFKEHRTLLDMFKDNLDIELAAYEVLSIMKKNKE